MEIAKQRRGTVLLNHCCMVITNIMMFTFGVQPKVVAKYERRLPSLLLINDLNFYLSCYNGLSIVNVHIFLCVLHVEFRKSCIDP